jgi:hypothetical protein
MKIEYIPKNFTPGSLAIIARAEAICTEYQAQGYDLTLRQLYYQFVARGYIPNKDTEYKRLGSIINDARLAGQLDWDFIVDRTRNLRTLGHWDDPSDIVDSAAESFRVDKWSTQPTRIEVWIEKDALVGVLDAVWPRRPLLLLPRLHEPVRDMGSRPAPQQVPLGGPGRAHPAPGRP